jgi:drug/metabolite transporter (DMT)-like permease
MTWIYLVLVAQFINAVVVLVDRHLIVSPEIGKPVIYTFYVGIMSGVVLAVLPFGLVSWPSLLVIWLSLIAGITFVTSLFFLYSALKVSDASDVSPAVGAVSAISTLLFSAWLLRSTISDNFLYGFVFLVIGTLLMSYFRLSPKAATFLVISGILFGLSSVFVKILFNHTTFWDGFFWSRMANVVAVLILLFWPANRKAIFSNVKKSPASTKLAVIINKVLAGGAFILILYAIKLGDVSIVNALSGVQFAFLLILAVIFTKKFPEYFHEDISNKKIIVQKLIATAFIAVGLALLFIQI